MFHCGYAMFDVFSNASEIRTDILSALAYPYFVSVELSEMMLDLARSTVYG